MKFCRLFYVLLLFSFYAHQPFAQSTVIENEVKDIILNIDTLSSDSLKVRTLLGFAGRKRYHPATLSLLKLAENLADNYKDSTLFIHSSYAFGNYYNAADLGDSAHYFFDRGLKISKIEDDLRMKASLLGAKASTFSRQGKLIQAVRMTLDATSTFEAIDTSGMKTLELKRHRGLWATLENSLANMYLQLDNQIEASKYYDQAIKRLEENKDYHLAGIVAMNKGVMYYENEQYDNAIRAYRWSFDNYDLMPSTPVRQYALSQSNLANAFQAVNKLDSAEYLYSQAVASFKNIGYNKGLMQARSGMGMLNLKRNKYQKALSDCAYALDQSSSISDVETKKKAHQCLYMAHRSMGNFKKALFHHEQFKELEDSLLNAENIRTATALTMQMNFDKETELQNLKIESDKKQAKTIQSALIAGLAGAAIIALLLYRLFRIRSKANNKLNQKNAIISQALYDKEILLKEIHHRVKNNLQVVSSLLNIQSKHIKNEAALEAIKEGSNRVQSMALIHKNLYQDEAIVSVNAQKYVNEMVDNLTETYKVGDRALSIHKDVDDVNLDVDTLIPLGLIMNELICNALKYAFIGKDKGTIDLSLKRKDEGLILNVSDDGIGMPEHFSIENSKSMGFTLVQAFSAKLKGDLEILNKNGTSISVKIPKVKVA